MKQSVNWNIKNGNFYFNVSLFSYSYLVLHLMSLHQQKTKHLKLIRIK